MKIVITDEPFGSIAYEQNIADKFAAKLSHHQCKDLAGTKSAVEGAIVVFVDTAPITREVLTAMAPGATVIRYGIGLDNVDLEAACELGVKVTHVPDYGVDTVADHATTLMLVMLRKLLTLDHTIRKERWANIETAQPIKDFQDTTIGILGAGRIGMAVAKRLQAFGMTILAFDPYADKQKLALDNVELVDFSDILKRIDGLTLHLPLTNDNYHIIDSGVLKQLDPGCVIVNTARGGLINESALSQALMDGGIAGAALDVFEPEPLAEDSLLRRLPNVLLTPHIAYYSERSLDNLQRLASEEANRVLAGELPRCAVT